MDKVVSTTFADTINHGANLTVELEQQTGHPITAELCTALLKYANAPEYYEKAQAAQRQQQSLLKYRMPFGQDIWS